MEILLLIFVIFYNNVNIKNYVVVYIFFMGKFCYGKKVVKIVVKYCYVEFVSGGKDIV